MFEMTREQFMELFDLDEDNAFMECADEQHDEDGKSWWQIAQEQIHTMNVIIAKNL